MQLRNISIAMEKKQGHVGHVDEWEREHKIKLHWNNWFDVSFAQLCRFLRLAYNQGDNLQN